MKEINIQEQLNIIKRGAVELISEEDIIRKLEQAKKERQLENLKLAS